MNQWVKKTHQFLCSYFKDKGYEELWMSNQIFIYSYVFETKHLHWLFGSHDLRVFSEWLVQKPQDSTFLFEDKTYQKLWMTNQVSFNAHMFENEHPHCLLGSHDLKVFSKWLVQMRNYNNTKSEPAIWFN